MHQSRIAGLCFNIQELGFVKVCKLASCGCYPHVAQLFF